VHICYIDDSGEDNLRVFSLISMPIERWRDSFEQWKTFRKLLRKDHGIFVKKEFHATEFVSGRGRIGSTYLSKERRCDVYRQCLTEITKLPGVRVFNAVAQKHTERLVFERLLNRLNRALKEWNSQAICVSDEGKDYNNLVRRMYVFNPIPSMFGSWANGPTKNIVLNGMVEQLFYRRSQESFFIQMADFCAYALLRSEKRLPSKDALGLHLAFDIVRPVCQTQCFAKDPRGLGIIRDH
jgi:hypothetical protein